MKNFVTILKKWKEFRIVPSKILPPEISAPVGYKKGPFRGRRSPARGRGEIPSAPRRPRGRGSGKKMMNVGVKMARKMFHGDILE